MCICMFSISMYIMCVTSVQRSDPQGKHFQISIIAINIIIIPTLMMVLQAQEPHKQAEEEGGSPEPWTSCRACLEELPSTPASSASQSRSRTGTTSRATMGAQGMGGMVTTRAPATS